MHHGSVVVDTEDLMAFWRDHVVPRLADKGLDTPMLRPLRDQVCAGLTGDVVEIGFGSGLNVAHYPTDVAQIWAVEPSDIAWRMAQPRILSGRVPVRRAALDAAALPLPSDRFHAALSTFTFCTIAQLDAALAEIHRVLRPGGELHFLEHGRAPDENVARWQDRLQPVYGPIAGGCHVTRPVAAALERSPLQVSEVRSAYVKGPRPFGCVSLGRAVKEPQRQEREPPAP